MGKYRSLIAKYLKIGITVHNRIFKLELVKSRNIKLFVIVNFHIRLSHISVHFFK